MSFWSGPYARHLRRGKGKGKGQKGWICSDECMESMTATPPPSTSGSVADQTFPTGPPLDDDQRPTLVLEVRDWLRTSFTVAELDVLFS